MNLWTTRENCPNGGQKCLYKFLSETGNTLKGTHTTPIKLYVDDIMYTFTTPETCATLRVIPPRSCGTPFWTTAPTTATF